MAEAAEKLEKAKRKRAALRGRTTTLLQKVEIALRAEVLDRSSLEGDLEQLQDKLARLTLHNNEVEDAIVDLDALEDDMVASEEYREKIIALKKKVESALKGPVDHERVQGNESRFGGSPSTAATVKLPTLVIDKFNGQTSKWINFWSQFNSSIENNPSLAKVDKFNYLRSYLEGPALSAIEGLTVSSENYDNAIKILQDRFGRKDIVINAHMSALLNLPSVQKVSDLKGLRRLLDSCELQMRNLESLGVLSDSYGGMLCPLLTKLLPEEITLEFSRTCTSDEKWNVDGYLKFLKNEIETRERSLLARRSHESNAENSKQKESLINKGRDNSWKPKERNNIGSTTALATSTEMAPCIYCKRTDHLNQHCKYGSVTERIELLKKERRCFICLKIGHTGRFCRSRIRCSNCNRRHNTSVCSGEAPMSEAENKSGNLVLSSMTGSENSGRTILLQTAQARIILRGRATFVRCLLDGGSQRTFIREDLSRSLRLPIVGREVVRLHTFGSSSAVEVTRNRVALTLCNITDSEKKIQIEALESPEICSALVKVPGSEIRMMMQGKSLQLADIPETMRNSELTVLIGADFYWQVATGKTEKINECMVAVETIFGYCIHGPALTPFYSEENSVRIMKIVVDSEVIENRALSQQMKAFWELESIGIVNSSDSFEAESNYIMQQFENSICFKDDRYQVALPWKEGIEELSDNYRVAENRLRNLVKRFKHRPNFYNQYSDVIKDYLNRGYIERVEEANCLESRGRTFYLPHQAVVREDKQTTKMRVVFDASAREKGALSLNDCLHAGPNLLPDLLTVLLKFRMHRVGFTADVEKAFLQIGLREKDRDAVRFLWPKEPIDKETMEVDTFRMTRVLFGVTSSPFLLSATIKHHLQKFKDTHPEVYKIVSDSLYMDDLVGGAETVEEACQLAEEANMIFERAGMTLRKWCTNSSELHENWNIKQGSEGETWLLSNPSLNVKVLGIVWLVQEDVFSFELSALLSMLIDKENTKRGVLKLAARLFDPVGFLTPFSIVVKCMFQDLWERGLEWDAPLPGDILESWNRWCEQLPALQNIKIPRYLFRQTKEGAALKMEIHCFCDASQRAYGACIYFRFSTPDGVKTCLVTSKARVAPLKKVTLPRLELMAALIGSRLTAHIRNILQGEHEPPCFFWTDSTIVFHWIHGSTQKWKPFVANRVAEIKGSSNPADWGHCPGRDNPADILTRGLDAACLQKSEQWRCGPPWLKSERERWPREAPPCKDETEINGELISVLAGATIQDAEKREKAAPLIDLSRYSNLSKLIRITAWIKRFIGKLKEPQKTVSETLTTEELQNAEEYWIKYTQVEAFQEDIRELQQGGSMQSDSKIKSLSAYLDEKGIMRASSRLQASSLSHEQSNPIILPKNSVIVQLLIQHYHSKLMHAGVSHTLSALRDKFWIIKGRQAVKSLLGKCLICRKFGAKPAQAVTAPLPAERTTEAPPFSVSAVDFAGPLFVKTPQGQEKAYIALFTCGVTRAIHLELVSNLNATNFLLAFRRFVARRGLCQIMYSDNAKTFKRADAELKHLWNAVREKEVQEFFGANGIKWRNSVECAAWWGGMWERLVRSVKICLKKTVGTAFLTFVELETTLIEIEATLNTRPITYVYNEVNEPVPLSPAQFFTGQKICTLPQKYPILGNTSENRQELARRMTYRNTLLSRFWNRWRQDYLMQLRSAHHRAS